VVAALHRTAHERGAVRIAVRGDEAEVARVKVFTSLVIFDEKDHVPDFDRRGFLIDRATLVHAFFLGPGVHAGAAGIDLDLARFLETHGHAVRIRAPDPAVLVNKARLLADALGKLL